MFVSRGRTCCWTRVMRQLDTLCATCITLSPSSLQHVTPHYITFLHTTLNHIRLHSHDITPHYTTIHSTLHHSLPHHTTPHHYILSHMQFIAPFTPHRGLQVSKRECRQSVRNRSRLLRYRISGRATEGITLK